MNCVLPEAVVLFGASGFIGRNIVDALADKIPMVVAVTRQTQTVPHCTRTVTMGKLGEVPSLPQDTVVINVAAHRYDASSFVTSQSEIVRSNSQICTSVYHFCAERGIREVRLASSVAVYPAHWEILDDARALDLNGWPHDREAAYAWSKRWAEICAEIYLRVHGIHTLTFRLTNPYGPYDSIDLERAHVAPAFVLKALSPAPTFEIRGNPKAERDFVYSGDVARVFLSSLTRRQEHDAFNLAYGKTTAIEELARVALEALGTSKPIVVSSQSESAVVKRLPTAEKLRKAFPELPAFTRLLPGLKATIAWYRDVVS